MELALPHYLSGSVIGKIGHSKVFKQSILALFVTEFLTLNSGLICQTLGVAGQGESETWVSDTPQKEKLPAAPVTIVGRS